MGGSLCFISIIFLLIISNNLTLVSILYIFNPFIVILINLINAPFEKIIKYQYINKAKKKLKASFAENSETISDIAENIGFSPSELREIQKIVQKNEDIIRRAWNEFFKGKC